MRRMPHRLASASLLAAAALAASGCAVGNTHTFRYTPQPGENLGQERVVLVFDVEDLRKDIVSGDEPPSWVGEQRAGFGIPYTITTTDRRAFAEVVQETLQRDLESVGFRTVTAEETSPESVAGLLAEEGADRALVVVMRNFNSDTYNDIDVEWDFEATVYDPSGRALASNHLEGRQEVKGSLMNPVKAAKLKVPPFFYDLMRQLVVGDREMMAALTRPPESPAPTGEEPRCTVDQILKMRDAGLTDEQIRAACGEGAPGAE